MNFRATQFRTRLLPILLAQALGIGCGILGVRLGSHLVAPADLGRYGVFVSLTPLGIWVVYVGLLKYVRGHWGDSNIDRGSLIRAVVRAGVRKTLWLLLAVAAVTLLATGESRGVFGVTLFLAALGLGVGQLAQTALQAGQNHWADCSFAGLGSLGRTFLPLLAYAWVSPSVEALLVGFALHALLVALPAAGWLARQRGPAGVPASRITPVYDGPLFIVLAVAGLALGGINRWLTAGLYGNEQAGYFTLAANIGAILPTVTGTVLLQYLQPGWFRAGATGAAGIRDLARDIDRMAAWYTFTALGLVLGLHLAMPLLVGPLVSERYAAASALVLPAGCFATAVLTASIFQAFMLAARREKSSGPPELSGVVVLAGGAVLAALLGWDWFMGWLVLSPLVPWLVNRPLARRAVLRLDAGRMSATGR